MRTFETLPGHRGATSSRQLLSAHPAPLRAAGRARLSPRKPEIAAAIASPVPAVPRGRGEQSSATPGLAAAPRDRDTTPAAAPADGQRSSISSPPARRDVVPALHPLAPHTRPGHRRSSRRSRSSKGRLGRALCLEIHAGEGQGHLGAAVRMWGGHTWSSVSAAVPPVSQGTGKGAGRGDSSVRQLPRPACAAGRDSKPRGLVERISGMGQELIPSLERR